MGLATLAILGFKVSISFCPVTFLTNNCTSRIPSGSSNVNLSFASGFFPSPFIYTHTVFTHISSLPSVMILIHIWSSCDAPQGENKCMFCCYLLEIVLKRPPPSLFPQYSFRSVLYSESRYTEREAAVAKVLREEYNSLGPIRSVFMVEEWMDGCVCNLDEKIYGSDHCLCGVFLIAVVRRSSPWWYSS